MRQAWFRRGLSGLWDLLRGEYKRIDWAGQEHRYTSGSGLAPFAAPEHIGNWMEKQFAVLDARKRFQMGRSPNDFAKNAAMLVNEINATYPFVDDNGRKQWLGAWRVIWGTS